MNGSLAPPPPYGSEQGSILLEAGRDGVRQSHSVHGTSLGHSRSRSNHMRVVQPVSPGPERSPTEISLAQLAHIPSREDIGEGTSRTTDNSSSHGLGIITNISSQDLSAPPPEYSSPQASLHIRGWSNSAEDEHHVDQNGASDIEDDESVVERPTSRANVPVPSYDVAVRSERGYPGG